MKAAVLRPSQRPLTPAEAAESLFGVASLLRELAHNVAGPVGKRVEVHSSEGMARLKASGAMRGAADRVQEAAGGIEVNK